MARNKRNRRAAAGKSNSLRIIAGRWRGRRIDFPDSPGLRPTSDRIRETVFNWLQPHIVEARVLDLFAGSGALGLEAASRGAAGVTLVDQASVVIDALNRVVTAFNAELGVTVRQQSALEFIKDNRRRFDMVFVDPPFDSGLYLDCLGGLAKVDWLKPGSKLYIESPKGFEVEKLIPVHWRIVREKSAGQVDYRLLEVS